MYTYKTEIEISRIPYLKANDSTILLISQEIMYIILTSNPTMRTMAHSIQP